MDYSIAQLDPALSKRDMSDMWAEVIACSGGSQSADSVLLSSLHEQLGARFGKDKSSKPNSVVDRAISKILERSGGNLKGLQRLIFFM
jgi:hypothetical protein